MATVLQSKGGNTPKYCGDQNNKVGSFEVSLQIAEIPKGNALYDTAVGLTKNRQEKQEDDTAIQQSEYKVPKMAFFFFVVTFGKSQHFLSREKVVNGYREETGYGF